MSDDYDLQRFLAAQEGVYDDALALLRGGAMCSDKMDFIFPRLLDGDPYGIGSLDEARAYLAFPVLGGRYRECVEALSWFSDETPAMVFGDQDAKKLHSSLTLFGEATAEPLLRAMLTVWFDNRADEDTMTRIDLVP
ncbi:MAG: DUF1810 family protein [Sphingomonas sp.]|jgi:uncharacterized protein (DUF1810 family)|uniref:DUF1810 family protein n=1 Tax=Sphingomonas sp. TaxID=28214 RepID=UPI00356A7015